MSGLFKLLNFRFKTTTNILRLREIVLMTGFSMIGVLFAGKPFWEDAIKYAKVCLFVLCYVMCVYFLNSFADYKSDLKSVRLKDVGKISRSNYLVLCVLFFIFFILLALNINMQVFLLSLTAFFLWTLYYLPPFRFKSSLFGGTFIHFLAGVLHFHTGYCCYGNINESSIIVSVFFAMLLSIGHFNHEILDYHDDMLSNNRTTAVRIGLARMYYLRTGLIFFALLYLITVGLMGRVDKTAFEIFTAPTVALFLISFILHNKEAKKFQKLSRALFLFSGLALLVVRLGKF